MVVVAGDVDGGQIVGFVVGGCGDGVGDYLAVDKGSVGFFEVVHGVVGERHFFEVVVVVSLDDKVEVAAYEFCAYYRGVEVPFRPSGLPALSFHKQVFIDKELVFCACCKKQQDIFGVGADDTVESIWYEVRHMGRCFLCFFFFAVVGGGHIFLN